MEEPLSEFEEAIREKNYARAVAIAESKGLPPQEVKDLKRKAVREFILESRNPQGSNALLKEYQFNKEEIDHLLREILEEAQSRGILDKKQYDIKTKRYLTLEEWIGEYFKNHSSRP